MCALRRIAVPDAPSGPSTSSGVSRRPVTPSEAAPTAHLAVGLVSTEVGCETIVHHHGGLETLVYVLEGTMAFHCGAGMKEIVTSHQGGLVGVAPWAVHAEFNPEADGPNLLVVARPGQRPAVIPCEVPTEPTDLAADFPMVPAPIAGGAGAAVAPGQRFASFAPHRLEAPGIAMDHLVLAPGDRFAPDEAATGETTLAVLRGAARLSDGAATLDGAPGDWLYVEAGTRWAAENGGTAPLDLLVIRCVAEE